MDKIIETYHPQLQKYKNLHVGETAYIFGCGPSINNFQKQDDGLFIGCNRIYFNEYIKNNLSYYFFGDNYTTDKDHKQNIDNLPYKLEKFSMVSRIDIIDYQNYTYDDVKQLKNINTLPCCMCVDNINKDISTKPFINHSIVYCATQFALFSGFTRIYIVGCDCTSIGYKNHYYDKVKKNKINKHFVEWWLKMKEFKDKYYPHSKFININPVGLKGLMDEDIFT